MIRFDCSTGRQRTRCDGCAGELRQDLKKRRTSTRTDLNVELRGLCTLCFFTTGIYQGALARDEDVAKSQSSESNTIHVVVKAIFEPLGDEWIAFPASTEELAKASSAWI